jgi:outer membrane protein assembly factor BamD (BamD/ComL family)
MSVAGISSSNLFNYATQSTQNKMQQFQQEFQQLGQDLQSGNMSAAQSDFATLQQYAPQSSSTSSQSSPIAQEFSQLAKDIQSGNTTAAQQDYSTIEQDFQSKAAHGHHHHGGGGSGSSQSTFSQLMSQLGQALQAGNLTSAQTAYSTLQQEFQQFSQNNGVASQSSTTSNNVSLSV